MAALFFSTQYDFRVWLTEHYKTETELLVGFYKISTGKASMTWSESVDQALCFGWIDGIRRTIDNESYSIRFSPRRKNSIWSDINIKKIEELTRQGLMTPEGLKAFSFLKDTKSGVYSYENNAKEFDLNYKRVFEQNKLAWDYFSTQAPSYQKVIKSWIMSAKQEKTRLTRLDKAIKASELQKRVM